MRPAPTSATAGNPLLTWSVVSGVEHAGRVAAQLVRQLALHGHVVPEQVVGVELPFKPLGGAALGGVMRETQPPKAGISVAI